MQGCRWPVRVDALAVTQTDENDYEDTITRHEYEHEHAYEYDARRYDYDLAQRLGLRARTCIGIPR
jgi:hypothetical protein